MEYWLIGELAGRAAVRPSAIRYYESAGLLPKPRRRNGRRIYDPSALQQLALIRLAQEAGFSLSEVRTLLHGFSRRTSPSKRWRALASRKLEVVRQQIEKARTMEQVLKRLLKCECPTLEDCGNAFVRAGDSC